MTKFSDLNLNPKVLKAIEEAGYETPTPIQAEAIPHALVGRDVLGIAQTGTGKTASFTLPMLSLLSRGRARARMPRSLVLCPTRELAAQVAENFDTYSKHLKLTKALLIGGVSFKEQDKLIDKGVDVLIATPGRLLDHFERGKLLLTGVQIMVVDEADRMLDMGFIPDIERIFSLTPFTRQTLFFSATMAPEIERITNTFLSNPARVEVARQATASETIEQGVVMFKPSRRENADSEKRKLLRALIDREGAACSNAIIFCNRKIDVDVVAKSLIKYGYDAAPIHGDLDQSQRTRTLDGFRAGTLRFLIASDVAARGLDVPAVSHVFNFDVPSHAEDYVHRIGRTGRAGRSGKALMICNPRDEKNLAGVESLIQKEIPRVESPVTFTPPTTETEPPQGSEERPAKPRRARNVSRGKPEERPAASHKAPETVSEQAVEATPPQERPQERRPERTPEPRQDRNRDRNDDNAPRHREGRGRQDHGGGPRVMGLGDHLPSFIALSFDERRTG
ncbi:ATP-dependent RNA helicase RhlE [Roseovarius sp. EC-HK134]|uniref:DEAD/DEAH box helicase n=1 Tax=unclassified Roseovarius TaxID=2614913 RepID=UPI0012540E5B|nr:MULTISPECIES: DEAD/DEAH box helicase [unclassified Roseovarius]VVT29076.1 ATP-dependent RNA helicase RhlE [Roseovarius sp. EC-HK134]VVT30207.1 ATP-dependent RNA helicase RhlE [Roseovarius sp. EC-SD190]